MIERYSRPEMTAIWGERRLLDLWQEIEALVAEGWAKEGAVPADAAGAIRAAPRVDVGAWKAREEITHHDLAAFVDVLAASVPEHGRWVHFGLTSSDILDTALAVRLGEAADLLIEGAGALFDTVRDLAGRHRDTAMIGRSHGMWAEPTTFGHKLAGFGFELARGHRRLRAATAEIRVGKISGPVGNHSAVPPGVEDHVLAALGLRPEPAATQVVARDRHAAFLSAAAVAGAGLDRLATEIRHLSRSEVSEVAEGFAGGQKGSSAMPHKRNPVRSENVTGLARLLRAYAGAGLEDVALWHERDISHSSVERVILPDACLVLDFALARTKSVLEGLHVDADRMRANLEAAGDSAFSHAALLTLIRLGSTRDDAYHIVQQASTEGRLKDALAEAGVQDVDSVFSLSAALRHAGESVDRLTDVTLSGGAESA